MYKTTLVIHPQDSSTVFLNDVYANIPNRLVIQEGKTKKEVYDLIKSYKVRGMSVGLEVVESQYVKGILIIQKAKLVEISLTSHPVNEFCKIEFCESFQYEI